MGMEEKLALAKETVAHAKIILDDMRANRSEYSSKDLSWRNVDLMYSIVEAFGSLTEAFEESLNVEREEEPDREEEGLRSGFVEDDDIQSPDKKEEQSPLDPKREEESLIAEEERLKERSSGVGVSGDEDFEIQG